MTLPMRITGTPLLGWCWSRVSHMLKAAGVGRCTGRLLYSAAVRPSRDLPLRRSFRGWGELRLSWSLAIRSSSGYRSMSPVTALFGYAKGTGHAARSLVTIRL